MAVRGGIKRRTGRGAFNAYLMIAPAVLLVAAFTLYPYIYAFWSSIRVMSPLLPPAFAGLKQTRHAQHLRAAAQRVGHTGDPVVAQHVGVVEPVAA
ncbi:MAG: hypothetical protein MUP04_05885, partial [Anaerolineae bacterium]|nr:hypothetical protein [Anaerolineae bacterium]